MDIRTGRLGNPTARLCLFQNGEEIGENIFFAKSFLEHIGCESFL